MKERNKVIYTYSSIIVAVFVIVTLAIFIPISLLIKSGYAHAGIPEMANTTIGYTGLILLGFVLISSVLIILLGKLYMRKIDEKIDTTFHTEKTFISNASHELNNPLTAIQGECEITLMKERTPQEYQIALSRIASETQRIIMLMKHLLFLSQGKEEILSNVVEPIPLAEFLMQFAQNRVSFSPDHFAFTVYANPNLLKIALENIINNALKYSDDKPVTMQLKDNILYIDDQGIGIPENDLMHIAQPFYRASNTGEYKGHGVGLSLSIQILNTYGAKVTISSEENEGTHFKVEFS